MFVTIRYVTFFCTTLTAAYLVSCKPKKPLQASKKNLPGPVQTSGSNPSQTSGMEKDPVEDCLANVDVGELRAFKNGLPKIDMSDVKVASIATRGIVEGDQHQLFMDVDAKKSTIKVEEHKRLGAIYPEFRICDMDDNCIGGDSSEDSRLYAWEADIPLEGLGSPVIAEARLCVIPEFAQDPNKACGPWKSAPSPEGVGDPASQELSQVNQALWQNEKQRAALGKDLVSDAKLLITQLRSFQNIKKGDEAYLAMAYNTVEMNAALATIFAM